MFGVCSVFISFALRAKYNVKVPKKRFYDYSLEIRLYKRYACSMIIDSYSLAFIPFQFMQTNAAQLKGFTILRLSETLRKNLYIIKIGE